MKKRDELERGCIARVADDEPVFVLRAQDLSADILVDLWAELALRHGASESKVDEAIDLAAQMRAWPNRKWPD